MTRIRTARRLAALVTTAGLAVGAAAAAAPAQATTSGGGTRSLAAVLAADGSGFDRNPFDYDIVENAALAVIAADSDNNSAVRVLTDGTVPVTAFIPNDQAFRQLANDVLGHKPRSEAQVLTDLAGLGLETIETVLTYHVVPGSTIDYRTALAADGAALTTAAGSAVTVDVKRLWLFRYVTLVDADPTDRDPVVVQANINRGNKQIAHGIDRVLRPLDL